MSPAICKVMNAEAKILRARLQLGLEAWSAAEAQAELIDRRERYAQIHHPWVSRSRSVSRVGLSESLSRTMWRYPGAPQKMARLEASLPSPKRQVLAAPGLRVDINIEPVGVRTNVNHRHRRVLLKPGDELEQKGGCRFAHWC